MVNTELPTAVYDCVPDYNILNIVVNTERLRYFNVTRIYYNILNIVVNTEQNDDLKKVLTYYNILNIVVNTEL